MEAPVKTRWAGIGLVILIAGMTAADVWACGDKFLVPSRGMRFQLTPGARERAAVLLYVNPATSLSGLFARLSIGPALRRAGYRPTIVADADEFTRTLRRANWDIVLLDLADGPLRDLPEAVGLPAVLGVAAHATGSEVARVNQHYAAVLKSPNRSQAFVEAIDIAIATRRADRPKAQK
jgi:hypothetical protein